MASGRGICTEESKVRQSMTRLAASFMSNQGRVMVLPPRGKGIIKYTAPQHFGLDDARAPAKSGEFGSSCVLLRGFLRLNGQENHSVVEIMSSKWH